MSCSLWQPGYRVKVKDHLKFIEVERSGVKMEDLTEGVIAKLNRNTTDHYVDVHFHSVNATIPFKPDELSLATE